MSDAVFAEASAWLFRLRADDLTPAEQQRFAQWLAATPQHVAAWDEAQALFAALETPARTLRQHAGRADQGHSSRRLGTAMRAVAAVLLCAVLGWLLQPSLLQNLQSDYHTNTGEQRQIQLADGSRVLLNTDTAVTVDLADNLRRVRVLRGEAFFEVTHAPKRPFWVVADETQAKVTGTAFSVGFSNKNVAVTVAEGLVETSTQAGRIVALKAGESASYQGSAFMGVQTIDLQKALAWRQGQMVFVQATLAEVVAQINRYRPGHLMITNKTLKNRPITAVFSVHQLDSAVSALEKTLGLRARRLSNYFILLG